MQPATSTNPPAITPAAVTVPGTLAVTGGLGTEGTLTPSSTLVSSQWYTIVFPSGALEDRAGLPYDPDQPGNSNTAIAAEKWCFQVDDTTAPFIVTYNPQDKTTGVAKLATVVLTFNEVVTRVTGKTITLVPKDKSQGATDITYDVGDAAKVVISAATDYSRVSFSVVEPGLASLMEYDVLVPAGSFLDTSTHQLPFAGLTAGQYTFTAIDSVPPKVTIFSPTKDAREVKASDTEIVLTFDEKVKLNSQNKGDFVLTPNIGKVGADGEVSDPAILKVAASSVAFSSRRTAEGTITTITPSESLLPGRTYVVTTADGPTGGQSAVLTDMVSNPWTGLPDESGSYRFSTGYDDPPAPPNCPVPSPYEQGDGDAVWQTMEEILWWPIGMNGCTHDPSELVTRTGNPVALRSAQEVIHWAEFVLSILAIVCVIVICGESIMHRVYGPAQGSCRPWLAYFCKWLGLIFCVCKAFPCFAGWLAVQVMFSSFWVDAQDCAETFLKDYMAFFVSVVGTCSQLDFIIVIIDILMILWFLFIWRTSRTGGRSKHKFAQGEDTFAVYWDTPEHYKTQRSRGLGQGDDERVDFLGVQEIVRNLDTTGDPDARLIVGAPPLAYPAWLPIVDLMTAIQKDDDDGELMANSLDSFSKLELLDKLDIIPSDAGPVVETDVYGTVTKMNHAAAAILGGEESLGKKLNEIECSVSKDQLDKLMDAVTGVVDSGTTSNQVMLDAGKSGDDGSDGKTGKKSKRRVAYASPERDEQGKLRGVLIDLSDKLVYTIGPDGRIVASNARGASLLVDATRRSRDAKDMFKGADVKTVVHGHGLDEYLTEGAREGFDKMIKDQKTDSEVTLDVTFGKDLSVPIRGKLKRSEDRPDCFVFVASTQPRSVWEDVLSGPVWVVKDDMTLANSIAKKQFSRSMLKPDFDFVQAAQGKYQSPEADHQIAELRKSGQIDEDVASELDEKAEPLAAAVQAAKVSGVISEEEVPFAFVQEDPVDVVEVIADVSPRFVEADAPNTGVDGVLVDGSRMLVLATDADGIVVDFNVMMGMNCVDATATNNGFDAAEWSIVGQSLELFAWNDDLAAMTDAAEKALEGQSTTLARVAVYSTDGASMLVMRGIAHPWYDEDLNPCGCIFEMQDMTASLFESDTLNQLVASDTLSAAWLLDPNGKIMKMNNLANVAMVGLDTTGALSDIFKSPIIKRAFDDAVSDALDGIPGTAQMEIDGKLMDVEITSQCDDLGNVVGVLVAKKMPAALTLDEDGLILECSEEAAKLIGFDATEIVGQEFMSLIGAENKSEVFDKLLQCLDTPGISASARMDTMTYLDGEVVMRKCKMEVVRRPLVEGNGMLVMLEALEDIQHMKYNKNSKNKGPKQGKREDVNLKKGNMRGMDASGFFEFKVEDVDLAKGEMGGALGSKKVPDEPIDKLLYYLLEQDASNQATNLNQPFSEQQLRSFLASFPDGNDKCPRPKPLQGLNAFKTKRIKALFTRMDQNKDKMVDRAEFEQWWDANNLPRSTGSTSSNATAAPQEGTAVEMGSMPGAYPPMK